MSAARRGAADGAAGPPDGASRAAGPGEGPDPAAGRGGVRRLTDEDATLARSRPFVENLAVVVGAFVVASLIAGVAGAANLGTALSFGQIGFALALVWVLVRR